MVVSGSGSSSGSSSNSSSSSCITTTCNTYMEEVGLRNG